MNGGILVTLYLLNSPILTSHGLYEYRKISIDKAKALVKETIARNGSTSLVSAIGHESTARVLSLLIDHEVPANRIAIKMEVNDQAIVFRPKQRLPEGKILTEEELRAISFELGLLKCLKRFD